AITDLRVMDMYGGFSISNYSRELENSRQKYLDMVKELRTVAKEFKELYLAGDEMALLAYRQMNYYKDIGETDMAMGDFLLNIPSDKALVTVMMEGNALVITNLVNLLAIGISRKNVNTLSEKISELYEKKDTLTHEDYYDVALSLSSKFESIRSKLIRYDMLTEEYNLEDDNMTDDEVTFLAEYAALAVILEDIKLGETSLADMLRAGEWDTEDLYPIAAALSEGQRSLIAFGQFETVLKYSATAKPIEELNKALDEIENDLKGEDGKIKPIDVYIGVDRSIFKGAFAMTTNAERQQAITGETWDYNSAKEDSQPFYIASYALAGVDAVMAGAGLGIVIKYQLLRAAARATFENIAYEGITAANAASFKATLFHDTWFPMAKTLGVAAAAVALITVGLVTISTWYNYYNPDYTEIPNTMIDVRSTSLGDKYVKYTAAKVHGDDGEKNADFNAYEAKEWVALYYTKDATAGNCLTPNFVHSDTNASVARRHQGISMFGATEAFNLNSHVYSKNAPGVYLTVRYSTAKKAAADLPPVVGSLFITGTLYALTALGGVAVGVGGTLAVNAIRSKRKENLDTQA
ncbi:MAG: hypothetical protein IIX69_05175, partial [Clostridia bacterium]|nr:hypothetical protein [Clostridia bacterium]